MDGLSRRNGSLAGVEQKEMLGRRGLARGNAEVIVGSGEFGRSRGRAGGIIFCAGIVGVAGI